MYHFRQKTRLGFNPFKATTSLEAKLNTIQISGCGQLKPLLKTSLQWSIHMIKPLFIRSETAYSPNVMPLGQRMLSVTRAVRSAPFKPLFSILAGLPQSVQYMKLQWQ